MVSRLSDIINEPADNKGVELEPSPCWMANIIPPFEIWGCFCCCDPKTALFPVITSSCVILIGSKLEVDKGVVASMMSAMEFGERVDVSFSRAFRYSCVSLIIPGSHEIKLQWHRANIKLIWRCEEEKKSRNEMNFGTSSLSPVGQVSFHFSAEYKTANMM